MSLRTDSSSEVLQLFLQVVTTKTSVLYCGTCKETHDLPARSDVTPYDHICPLCNFQVLNVRSPKGKEFTICPHCYSNPPSDLAVCNIRKLIYSQASKPETSLQSPTMPCFKCTAKCALARGVSGGNTPVLACPHCGKDMVVRKQQTGGHRIGMR